MTGEPFIEGESRPDLTLDVGASGGRSEPRPVGELVGGGDVPGKLKEAALEKLPFADKFPDKEIKEAKERKEHKEQKDHKDPKDSKDQKDQKDPKEQKDQKDQKEQKDHKDLKDHKEQKDLKDHIKESVKDHIKEPIKESLKDTKELIKDRKDVTDVPKVPDVPPVGPGPVENGGLADLVRRVTGLEQDMANLREGGGGRRRGG
jgi:hypothetical protein